MRVFLTGGTGAIGREATKALVGAGHDVAALARSEAKAAWLASQGAEPVMASLFDVGKLTELFRGCDAVANLATALPSTSRFLFPWSWKQNTRVRTEGSRAVVDAALAAGVRTVLQESVVMLYTDCGSSWIDEDTPADRFPMAEANLAAEANAVRFGGHGRQGVVLRLGWFYGPGARHSEEFFALARRHVIVTMGNPDTYVSSIHVADAGRAVAAALDIPNGIYNVVDDEPLTKRAYAQALAGAAQKKPWLLVPGRAALFLGNRTTSLTRSLGVTNSKFRNATGWAPQFPSAREGWLATARNLTGGG